MSREALQLSGELGELELEAVATFFRGLTETLDMVVDPARVHLEAARALHRKARNPPGEGLAVATLALTFLMTGESDRAHKLLTEALAIQVAAGYGWGEGHANLYLGLTLDTTDPPAATTHYRRGVECLRPYRDAVLLPNALIGQAWLIADRDPASALRVTAAGWATRVRRGGGFPPFFRERLERVRAKCEAALGAEAERIWSQGTRIAVDDAIALAFGAPPRRASAPADISARELDVVRLLADGLANKAIAAQLHLSVRTVESHVRNVLAKTRLSNRTQLARWARGHIQ